MQAFRGLAISGSARCAVRVQPGENGAAEKINFTADVEDSGNCRIGLSQAQRDTPDGTRFVVKSSPLTQSQRGRADGNTRRRREQIDARPPSFNSRDILEVPHDL